MNEPRSELVKPVESRIWYADLVTDIHARESISACRDDAIDMVKPDRSTHAALLELKPRHCSGIQWASVRVGGWSGTLVPGNTCLEPNRREIKHGDGVDIEVVATEKLDRGEAAEDQVGRRDPRACCIGDICRRSVLDHVERDVLAIQSCCGKGIEIRLAQASARCTWIELCDIVKDGESSSGGGNWRTANNGIGDARVVLKTMADSNLLKNCSRGWRGKT